jgi:ArsR family transcriptional regulator, arsenate/arsenite/antimonite-responsive transcriptional repressor
VDASLPLYSPAVKTSLVTLFQALADPTRLRLLNLMAAREVCVCYFVEVFDEPQPKISRHLAYLRRAGLVTARRDGKWIHYSLAQPSDPAVAEVLNKVLDVSSREHFIQRDRRALEQVCCAAKPPASLQHAPKPQLARPRNC